jgi:hypothetical protein
MVGVASAIDNVVVMLALVKFGRDAIWVAVITTFPARKIVTLLSEIVAIELSLLENVKGAFESVFVDVGGVSSNGVIPYTFGAIKKFDRTGVAGVVILYILGRM